MRARHREGHRIDGLGWLRAGVLGANDGIVSISSLILGVAAAHAARGGILVSGIAGVVAGALSMGIGEYVSVHSQADSEAAALDQERAELEGDPAGERRELTEIYVRRGLERALAGRVAEQLMAHDALAAHARDELGFSARSAARPVQAALTSAASFTAGAIIPLLVAAIAPDAWTIPLTIVTSLLCLTGLGALSAAVADAPMLKGALRIAVWSALAMGVSVGVGTLVGTLNSQP
jgi:VIT1/CCC1 family predicted Fe2+/Mn2+ transporter